MFCYHCSMARNQKRCRQSAYSSEGYIPQTRTYQTRIAVYEGIDRSVGDAALSAYAALYGKVQHKLFADVAAGRVGGVQEERVYRGARDTGADVQRGADYAGRQGVGGSGVPACCNWIA